MDGRSNHSGWCRRGDSGSEGKHPSSFLFLHRMGGIFCLICLAWTAVVGASLWWNLTEVRRKVWDTARREARSAFLRDLAYVRWNAREGGVYISSLGTNSPPFRDETDPGDRVFTHITPSSMIARVHGFREGESVGQGYFAVLDPSGAKDAVDPWERKAFEAIRSGEPEFASIETLDGQDVLRLLRPVALTQTCLRCHHGDHAAAHWQCGIVETVPLAPLERKASQKRKYLITAHALFWMLGLGGIGLGTRGVRQRVGQRGARAPGLREEEEPFQAVVASAYEAVLLVDGQGSLLYWNPAASLLFGCSPQEMAGRRLDDLLPGEEGKGDSPWPKEHPPLEREAVRVDGSTFPAEVSVRSIRVGSREKLVVQVRDITQRKRAEERQKRLESQLQEVRRIESLGTLAGGIAHDFNTLLMTILGNAELALMDLPPASPARSHLHEIEKAAHRVEEICKAMLAYSGKGRRILQRVELSALLEEMGDLLKVTVSPHIAIRFHLDQRLPPVEADPEQLRQMVMNLVCNAAEAMEEEEGRITLSTGVIRCEADDFRETWPAEHPPAGRYVFLEVCDTGCGMDPDLIPRVFDPFFTTKFIGRGLGLAAVLGIVRSHGGAVRIRSQPGRGTTVRVFLPALGATGAEEERGGM